MWLLAGISPEEFHNTSLASVAGPAWGTAQKQKSQARSSLPGNSTETSYNRKKPYPTSSSHDFSTAKHGLHARSLLFAYTWLVPTIRTTRPGNHAEKGIFRALDRVESTLSCKTHGGWN